MEAQRVLSTFHHNMRPVASAAFLAALLSLPKVFTLQSRQSDHGASSKDAFINNLVSEMTVSELGKPSDHFFHSVSAVFFISEGSKGKNTEHQKQIAFLAAMWFLEMEGTDVPQLKHPAALALALQPGEQY